MINVGLAQARPNYFRYYYYSHNNAVVCTKFKIGGIKRSIDKAFLVNSVVIKVADSCGASLAIVRQKQRSQTHSGGKNNSIAIYNSLFFTRE